MEKNHEIIDHLIRKARAEKASDIHISEGMPTACEWPPAEIRLADGAGADQRDASWNVK